MRRPTGVTLAVVLDVNFRRETKTLYIKGFALSVTGPSGPKTANMARERIAYTDKVSCERDFFWSQRQGTFFLGHRPGDF